MVEEEATGPSIAAFRAGYEEDGELRGRRCACGFVTATFALLCPRCGARELVPHRLATTGRVVALSVQHVPGDAFLNEAPYAYVLVELDGGGRISGWMDSVRSEEELAVGARVRWVPTYKPGVRFERAPEGPPAPGA